MIKVRIKKFLVELLLLTIKTLFFVKNILVFIVVYIIYKPLKAVLSFLFFRLIINLYYKYILIYKKIKEINKRNKSKLYIIKRNYPILALIMFLTLIMVNENNKKDIFLGKIHKTVLAQTIVSDFQSLEPEELIIERAYQENSSPSPDLKYIETAGSLKNVQKVSLSAEDKIILPSSQNLSSPGIASTERAKDARKEITEYIIQNGDTISSIAQDFGISVNTILWENNLTARSLIKPGNTLKILPETGLMHTIARNETISGVSKKYDISSEKILNANNLDPEEVLKLGQKIFIPGGKKIVAAVASTPAYTGTTIASSIKTTPTTNYSGGKLLWPTVGHRITQYYSWSHQGLDIANKTGTPLYASESGTVERSGWNNGYGYNVVINHGGGLKTLYAHASKLHVKAGDVVSRGDIVADMGSTGWSTGPHIHFEVILNGVKQNPLNYIQ
ncbi:MAG: peptidoglycan DD-metalloendopeptidase family protein [Patescibacteria group bacterium]